MQQDAALQPPKFVDLNVLPEELRPPRYSPWYVLAVIAVLVLSLLLIPLYRVEQARSADTADLRAELDLIDRELTRMQIEFGGARDARQQIGAIEATIARLDEERRAILGDQRDLSADLSALVAALPPGAHLVSITASEGQLTLTGRAAGSADVLAYSRSLAGSGKFSGARITSLTIAGGQQGGAGVSFTIEAAQ